MRYTCRYGKRHADIVTLDELKRDWRDYALALPKSDALLIIPLTDHYIECLGLNKDNTGLLFARKDGSGNNTLASDEEDNMYYIDVHEQWQLGGGFVKWKTKTT